MISEVKLKAYAKINLTLDICGKRQDGYHLLDSVFQSVSLFDEVKIEKSDRISVSSDVKEISGRDNTAYISAEKFFSYTKISGGVSVHINKNIPLASGMGGGSADAAAVITGLDRLYGTALSRKELMEIGLTVGADVPFCIVGGTARVGGIGERVEKITDLVSCPIVILKVGEKSSTKDMYRKIDCMPTVPPKTEDMIKSLNSGDINSISKNLGNAFLSVSDCQTAIDRFENYSPLGVSLSGSGPTVFAIFDRLEKAQNCADDLGGTVVFPKNIGISE